VEGHLVGEQLTGLVVEGVVRGPHVGPPRRGALDRHDLGREDGALGLGRHVRAVVVPALVAAERLHDVVTGIGVDLAVAAEVGDRRGLELERAEAAGEVVLLVTVDELAREDEQGVLEPRRVQLLPGRVVEVP
jgi:hypothetical protein